jgi:hypothetical protein
MKMVCKIKGKEGLGDMEIIQKGTDDVAELAVRGCCWPPGTEGMSRN